LEPVGAVARFMADPDSDELSDELVDAYYDGLPTETLRPLLLSGDRRLVGAAVYIAWDVVDDASAVLSELCDVLDSEGLPRSYVVDAVRQTGTLRGDVLVRVLNHIDDSNKTIASEVISFLSDLAPEQLNVLVERVGDPGVAEALREHLGKSRLDSQATSAALSDPDVRIGRIATAKALSKLTYAGHPRAAAPAVAAEAEELLYEIRDGPDPVAAYTAGDYLFSLWSDGELEPRRRRDRWRVRWQHFRRSGPTPRNLWEKLQFRIEELRCRGD
jgi:hypothetical protein